jgi:hypothetical protein
MKSWSESNRLHSTRQREGYISDAIVDFENEQLLEEMENEEPQTEEEYQEMRRAMEEDNEERRLLDRFDSIHDGDFEPDRYLDADFENRFDLGDSDIGF